MLLYVHYEEARYVTQHEKSERDERPEKSLVWALRKAMRWLHKARRIELEPFDITPVQANMLHMLSHAGNHGLPMNEMTKRHFVTPANTTRIIDRLEADGYVVRERDTDDRRVIRARLTPKGWEFEGQLRPLHRELGKRHEACFTPDELKQFIGYLDRLAEHTRSRYAADDDEEWEEHHHHHHHHHQRGGNDT